MRTLVNAWKSSRTTRIAVIVVSVALVSCCGVVGLTTLGDDAALEPTATAAQSERMVMVATSTRTPVPTATETATRTDTPEPTETVRPAATPTATPLPPTDTPYPTATSAPTATATPEASPTPAATDTPPASPTPSMQAATVSRVIDGDTIEVVIDGQAHTLRYIGIDSPEGDSPSASLQQYAQLATQANAQLVLGQTVYLEKDVSETDQYGRLLRYVYLASGTMVNAELVRLGYAQASAYPPDVARQSLLDSAEAEARAANRGLWAPTPEPTAGPAAPSGAQVVIIAVDKRAEYVDIRNNGDQAQDLSGWVLLSERGNQACGLGGVLEAGQTLRIWALAADAGQGGYNCGFGSNIWNNSESDPAALYDAAGTLVDRY